MIMGIVGSRKILLNECEEIIRYNIIKYKVDAICSGGCVGVDKWGEMICDELSLKKMIFYPDWSLGKHAGMLRNSIIVDNSDILLVIFSGSVRSGGSYDTYKKAKRKGIKVIEVFIDNKQMELCF